MAMKPGVTTLLGYHFGGSNVPVVSDSSHLLSNDGLVGRVVIMFVETGLLFPFLPGDTLLFAAGVIAAQATTPVDIWTLTPCTALAAVLGTQCGYFIGRSIGPAPLPVTASAAAAFIRRRRAGEAVAPGQ